MLLMYCNRVGMAAPSITLSGPFGFWNGGRDVTLNYSKWIHRVKFL